MPAERTWTAAESKARARNLLDQVDKALCELTDLGADVVPLQAAADFVREDVNDWPDEDN